MFPKDIEEAIGVDICTNDHALGHVDGADCFDGMLCPMIHWLDFIYTGGIRVMLSLTLIRR
jgi:hypothetical protein